MAEDNVALTPYTYYHDHDTDTIRCYQGDSLVGNRWCKERHLWSPECCARSGCQWDEVITPEQAQKVIERQ